MRLPKDVVAFVRNTNCSDRRVSAYGLDSHQVEGRSGVWILEPGKQDRKICAIGIAADDATMHGLALNVTTNLDEFMRLSRVESRMARGLFAVPWDHDDAGRGRHHPHPAPAWLTNSSCFARPKSLVFADADVLLEQMRSYRPDSQAATGTRWEPKLQRMAPRARRRR